MTIKEQAQIAVKVLDEKLAEDIVILEIGEISVIGDYFIIATGKNVNHVRALFDRESREYYNLERIWRDAKNIEAEEFLK